MKITESFIANLLPSPTKKVYFDDDFPEFGVRSYKSGNKTYIIRYHVGKYRRCLKTICDCRSVSLQTAIAMAKKQLLSIDLIIGNRSNNVARSNTGEIGSGKG